MHCELTRHTGGDAVHSSVSKIEKKKHKTKSKENCEEVVDTRLRKMTLLPLLLVARYLNGF